MPRASAKNSAYVRPHRHGDSDKWEFFTILQARARVLAFDKFGTAQERHELAPAGAVQVEEIAADIWHKLVMLEPTVLLEVKQGSYTPAGLRDFAPWTPHEGAPAAVTLER